jgi:hypothetical protein
MAQSLTASGPRLLNTPFAGTPSGKTVATGSSRSRARTTCCRARRPRARGIVLDAPADGPTIRANRVWDNQRRKTQTHGLWITTRGTCRSARVEDNDLVGNVVGALRCDTEPSKGHWDRNLGVPLLP